jgi:hypothetical protein
MANQKTMCPKSSIFDAKHLSEAGRSCPHRHKLFSWKATGKCMGLLIIDSLGKWIMDAYNYDVQAISGLTIRKALLRILDGTLTVENYEYILFHVGTNDTEAYDEKRFGIPEMQTGLDDVVREIKRRNPFTTIAISSVLPRPKDTDEGDQLYRLHVNAMFYNYTRHHGHQYIESWRCVTNDDGSTKRGLYAGDLLHLRDPGTLALKLHFQGYLGAMQQRNWETWDKVFFGVGNHGFVIDLGRHAFA